MEKNNNYLRAGKYQLFHGSMSKFDHFSLDYKGLNGTADGFGIYLTPNKDMASMYAEQTKKLGYIYEVTADLEKPLSTDELTITDKELSKIIDILQESTNILNDFNDVDYYGEKVVKREAIAMLKENDNDVDLINEIANTTGDTEKTAEALYNVGHYTHIVANERLLQEDTVVVVLQPERINIERVQDLNKELDVPAITENSHSGDKEKLSNQEEAVRLFWKGVLEQNRSFDFVGVDSNGTTLHSGTFVPDPQDRADSWLMYFDNQGEMIKQYIMSIDEIEEFKAGKKDEFMSQFPHGAPNIDYKILFHEENEFYWDWDEDIKGIKVPEVPIKDVIIKDFEQELETDRYYDKQAWQERIEYLNSNDPSAILRFSLDEDVEEFYKSHSDEIEDKLSSMAEVLGVERNALINESEATSEVDYKRYASIMAYKIGMDEINNDIENGTFKIPAMSEETENRILTVRNMESKQTFEME